MKFVKTGVPIKSFALLGEFCHYFTVGTPVGAAVGVLVGAAVDAPVDAVVDAPVDAVVDAPVLLQYSQMV